LIQFVLSTGLIILVHEFQGLVTVILTGYFKENERITEKRIQIPAILNAAASTPKLKNQQEK